MKTIPSADLEKKIKELGAEIINRLNSKPSFLSAAAPKGWSDSLISLSLKNSRVKTGLFQLIDVLPSIKTDTEVAEIFSEYLGGAIKELPLPFRQAFQQVEKGKWLGPLAAKSIRSAVKSLSSHFILGNTVDQAKPAIEHLKKTNRKVSLDLLGELTVCPSEGIHYQTRYLNLLDDLVSLKEEGESQISVKVSSLYHRLDPLDWENSIEMSLKMLRPVFRKAKQLNTGIILDMESFYYKDLILKIFTTLLEEEEFREKPAAGIAVQAYLKEFLKDLNRLISWARSINRPILVRLVKGAYWDTETAFALQRGWPIPVLAQKAETDLQFEEGLKLLIENNRVIQPVIASHNIRNMTFAMALNDILGFPKEHLEFQMLYGMAEPLQKAVAGMGYSLRVYAPIGDLLPGMAYLIRRLMENSANTSILHQTFSDKPASMDLLNPPQLNAKSEILKTDPPAGFKNEPPLDFSIQENRDQVQNGLKKMVSRLQHEVPLYPLLLNGKKVSTGKTFNAVNPSLNAQVLGRVSQASLEQGKQAVEAALRAFSAWKQTLPSFRTALLLRVARHFQQIRHELIAMEILEIGKTWKEADGDVCEAIDFLTFYANEMIRLDAFSKSGKAAFSFPGEENSLSLHPYGVMAAIPPWNFPLALAAGMVAAGLVTGNCVIFKPSSLSQILGAKIVEAFLAEGVPPGVLQFLPGEGKEIGEFLAGHPDIPLITFTGSNEVGRRILEVSSRLQTGQKQFKKVIAEMGGKNAIIIDESANLDEAVLGVIESAFGFQGQKCSACSRLIVHQAVYDHFVKRLVEATDGLVRGDPQSPSTFLGPVIDEKAKVKIQSYINIGLKEATVLYHRKEESPGYFIGPVIFEDVRPDSVLATEEIFGPVLSIFKAENFDRALTLANHSNFALTGGVYSRKPSHLARAKSDFHVGNLYLNRKITGALVGRQPFGGFQLSGVGMKAGGPDYLLQFMQVKSIGENTARKGYIP
ncbi:MAG: bifunctional proline dehydrogenase/L-glutamate gamma-semialdehyde dehydrogenase [Nitrospirae bacterium]|nr:bifunctional proline dehydrogenase/L-glutamate gamma-semialdehyde dehydrogenase [Nitrospirota bacterium]